MFNDAYKNKKVLVTGHTGFKGGWLSLWLSQLGAQVLGYSLEPNITPSFYNAVKLENQIQSVFGDIRDIRKLNDVIEKFKPEIIFHLAAQSLVRQSYFEPITTYETNVMGTLNMLEASRKCGSVKAFVNVTSDKCYENREADYCYRETDPMGGHDIYSSSKGCSEILTASYRRSFLQNNNSFALASARAGNVIGGGDWALDRLIPDCAKSISMNKIIIIRNPNSVRPWQFVLEPLSGYLILGKNLLEHRSKYSEGYNFGPNEHCHLKVIKVAEKFIEFWGKGDIIIEKSDNLHEANLLKLNISKAETDLGWKTVYTINQTIQETAEWYKCFYNNEQMFDFSLKQINEYTRNCNRNGKIT
jgi:CDP-glucose 4,6-dehydratase